MTKLLIVDDDRALLTMLTSHFEMKDFEVLTAENGVDALEKLGSRPDLILLDVNMPRMDGLQLCHLIRDKVACPILFLTAKVDEDDRVNGLLSGGDDYITKPFSLKELDARIAAHLKREQRHNTASACRFQNGLIIDYGAKTVHLDGNCLELTKAEYGIMEFLSMHPGIVFDRERIYEKVCGWDAEGDSRVITELIRRIRSKLRAFTETEYIETVWGMGYRWAK
ncbi:MAG: response regulator transcription factor [Firmicutes bacterium]|nr:response regulator transcription factor [Bacillota bacterium]